MRLQIFRLAERPDLGERFDDLNGSWPPFMYEDPIAGLYYGYLDQYADYVLIAVDAESPGRLVGRACSIPFRTRRSDDGTPNPLPDGGWDTVIRWSAVDRLAGRSPDAVSA